MNFTSKVLGLLALCACTQKSDTSPPSAARTVPQIYVLRSAPQSWWAFPGRSLQESVGARVIEEKVDSREKADEVLRAWNARPVDLLILEPGFAQQSFLALTLPKVAKRRVIFLGGEKPKRDDIGQVEVDGEEVFRFLKDLCEKECDKGCRIFGESTLFSTARHKELGNGQCKIGLGLSSIDPSLQEMWVNLRVEWEALVRDLLKNEGQNFVSTPLLLRISDARLKVSSTTQIPETKRKNFAEYFRQFTLKHL